MSFCLSVRNVSFGASSMTWNAGGWKVRKKRLNVIATWRKPSTPSFQVKLGTLLVSVGMKSLGTFHLERSDVDLGYSRVFAQLKIIIARNDEFHFRPPVSSDVAINSNETSSVMADAQLRSPGKIWVFWKRHGAHELRQGTRHQRSKYLSMS